MLLENSPHITINVLTLHQLFRQEVEEQNVVVGIFIDEIYTDLVRKVEGDKVRLAHLPLSRSRRSHDFLLDSPEYPNQSLKMTRIVQIKEAPANSKHKWVAHFTDPDKKTPFGARGFQDYTQHKDPERRRLYRERHHKDLATRDPTRAGFLSYYLLWGDSTDIQENLRRYKKVFNL